MFPRKRESRLLPAQAGTQRTQTWTSLCTAAFAAVTAKAPHPAGLRDRRPLDSEGEAGCFIRLKGSGKLYPFCSANPPEIPKGWSALAAAGPNPTRCGLVLSLGSRREVVRRNKSANRFCRGLRSTTGPGLPQTTGLVSPTWRTIAARFQTISRKIWMLGGRRRPSESP